MTDMRLVVAGAAGRMGKTLIRSVTEMPGVVLIGALERRGAPEIGLDAGVAAGIQQPLGVTIDDDPDSVLQDADGLIDFSAPEATVAYSRFAAKSRIVHVIGTTGFSKEDDLEIEEAAHHAVVVRSANMSLGINLLAALARQVAAILDESFDIEILEAHHKNKRDSPSGTALMLGQSVAEGRGVEFREKAVFGRGADPTDHTPRKAGEIGVSSQRLGSVICDHYVTFGGDGERLELVHRADDRAIFARGAIRAALWGRNRKSGLYSLSDVLGLSKH